MSDIAISVENLYKEYRLGVLSHGTLRHDLQSWWARFRDNDDPNAKIEHSRTTSNARFLALDGISFDVEQGDVLGIIGRNGAGKSTLLKIISRITAPTKGLIKIKGRVASLLEVGTGFHPELTGGENIYLNGAILGMTRREIDKKFHEIVDFAEIEKFIDTPVKRYSSGMHVRLAFAVAAHLEPEIMIVDEVLAVGDAKFQKKCLGKMERIGKEGRTVLFVSHNMPMITSLCKKAILLNQGTIADEGPAAAVVQQYYHQEKASGGEVDFSHEVSRRGDDTASLLKARILDSDGRVTSQIDINDDIFLEMEYEVMKPGAHVNAIFHIHTADGVKAFITSDVTLDPEAVLKMQPGRYLSRCKIPGNFLNDGTYYVGFAMATMETSKDHFHQQDLLSFIIIDSLQGTITRGKYGGAIPGIVRPALEWESRRL